jgi:hypothetical protein
MKPGEIPFDRKKNKDPLMSSLKKRSLMSSRYIFFLIKGFPPISIKETTGYKVHHLTQPPPKFTELFSIFLSAASLKQRMETTEKGNQK